MLSVFKQVYSGVNNSGLFKQNSFYLEVGETMSVDIENAIEQLGAVPVVVLHEKMQFHWLMLSVKEDFPVQK